MVAESSVQPHLVLAMGLICLGNSSTRGRKISGLSLQFSVPTSLDPGRFSNGGEERISGVEKLTNGDGEEELKRQSIDKVNLTKEGNLNLAYSFMKSSRF